MTQQEIDEYGLSLREEQVEWLGHNFTPTHDGVYYCKVLARNSGTIKKYCVTYEKGEWQFGSAAFLGAMVLEWMRPIIPNATEKNPAK